MKVERVRPGVLQLTLHATELSSLIAAARLVAEGPQDDLPTDARAQLHRVLADYDQQLARLGGR